MLETVKQVRHYKNVAIYLLARMLYNDGMVGVLVFGGVYAAGNFEWDTISLLIFGLCTSVTAMFGAYLGGIMDDRLGSLLTLKVCVPMTAMILLGLVSIEPDRVLFVVMVSTDAVWDFPYFSTPAELIYFATNQVFALFVTALSASRTLMARISPPDRATQFFGLYGLSGSITAFPGAAPRGNHHAVVSIAALGFASLFCVDPARRTRVVLG